MNLSLFGSAGLPEGCAPIDPASMSKQQLKEYSKGRDRFVAHAHFIRGVQVHDMNCEYCVGVPKPVRTPEEIAARQANKQRYIEEWRRNKYAK